MFTLSNTKLFCYSGRKMLKYIECAMYTVLNEQFTIVFLFSLSYRFVFALHCGRQPMEINKGQYKEATLYGIFPLHFYSMIFIYLPSVLVFFCSFRVIRNLTLKIQDKSYLWFLCTEPLRIKLYPPHCCFWMTLEYSDLCPR